MFQVIKCVYVESDLVFLLVNACANLMLCWSWNTISLSSKEIKYTVIININCVKACILCLILLSLVLLITTLKWTEPVPMVLLLNKLDFPTQTLQCALIQPKSKPQQFQFMKNLLPQIFILPLFFHFKNSMVYLLAAVLYVLFLPYCDKDLLLNCDFLLYTCE